MVTKNPTRVVIFNEGKPSTVFNPPLKDSEVTERIIKAILQNVEIRSYYYPDKNLEIIRTLILPHYTQPWHIAEKLVMPTQDVKRLENRQREVSR